LIWENKHLHLYAGMGAGLIFEPFVTYTKSRDPYEEPVYYKNGQTVSGLKAFYIPGMSLFSVIYSASASASYHLNKRLSFYSGIQLKQGLKQMIASICYFTQYDNNGDPLFYSFETGTASGQSIILNFGLNYTF